MVHHEWGAGFVALALAQFAGAGGIVLLKFSLATVLAVVTWRLARFRGASVAQLAFFAPIALLPAINLK